MTTAFNEKLAGQILERFRGRTSAYGRKTPNDYVSEKKALTVEVVAHHLNGGPAIGMYQIEPGRDTVQFAAFDIDDHDGSLGWQAVQELARRLDAELRRRELYTFRVRSGGGQGIHLTLFWQQPQRAADVRDLMDEILKKCRRDSDPAVEVFPKEDHVALGKYGHLLALPFARESVPLDENFEPLPKEQALDRLRAHPDSANISADAKTSSEKKMEKKAKEVEPDIDWSRLLAALKQIPSDDYDNWLKVGMALHWAGEQLCEPERAKLEWDKWSQKSGKFKAENQERVWRGFTTDRDNVVTVATIFSMMSVDGDFEELVCIETKPPTWKLKVQGKWLQLDTAQLDTYRQVRRAAMEQRMVLPEITGKKWTAILTGLMSRVRVEEVSGGSDLSEEGVIWAQVLAFLTNRARAKAKDELLQGKPWFDEDSARVYFRTQAVLHHLRCQHNYAKPKDLCLVLRDKGGDVTTLSLKGTTERMWWVPMKVVEPAIQDEEFTVHELPKEKF